MDPIKSDPSLKLPKTDSVRLPVILSEDPKARELRREVFFMGLQRLPDSYPFSLVELRTFARKDRLYAGIWWPGTIEDTKPPLVLLRIEGENAVALDPARWSPRTLNQKTLKQNLLQWRDGDKLEASAALNKLRELASRYPYPFSEALYGTSSTLRSDPDIARLLLDPRLKENLRKLTSELVNPLKAGDWMNIYSLLKELREHPAGCPALGVLRGYRNLHFDIFRESLRELREHLYPRDDALVDQYVCTVHGRGLDF